MKLRSLLAQFLLTTLSTSSLMFAANQAAAQTVTNASDNAGNYPGGWTNGANGGFGFAGWQLAGSAGTNGFNGSFIGAVPAPNYSSIATAGNAFSIYAGGDGAYQDAARSFSTPMTVGQTLTQSLGITFDNGNKGFALFNGATEVFFFNVNNTGYSWSGGGSNAPTPWETRSNGVVINLSVTRTASGFDYGISSAQDAALTKTGSVTAAGITSLKYYISGAGDGALGNLYFNNLQIAGPAPTTITNQVTFSVNMSYQASQGLFSSNSNTVQVRSSFDNWSTNNQLTNQGNNIYLGTFNVTGNEASVVEYKFWNSFLTNTASQGYEDVSNRSLTLGANGATNTLPVVYFSNLAGERFVTFSVNMAIQQGKGAFNPATNSVEVRGPFNGWNGNLLTNVPGGSIYSGTFLLSSSNANTSIPYKFYAAGTNAAGWEVIPGAENRTFDLVFNTNASNAPALVLTTNFFSNELFYVTGTPLSTFSTAQGTASTAQSVTVNGQGLSGNIVATAPTGYEVSTDDVTYAASLSLVPASGVVSSGTVYVRIKASAAAGSPAGNVQMASTGSQSVNVAVSGTVTSSYSPWAVGYGLDPSVTTGPTAGAPTADPDSDGFNNQSEYAFGTNPTAGNAALLTTSVSGGNMVVTWFQRTDAAAGAYKVKTTTSLATPFAVNNTLTAAVVPGSATAPTGYESKQVSVAITGERNFLALAFD